MITSEYGRYFHIFKHENNIFNLLQSVELESVLSRKHSITNDYQNIVAYDFVNSTYKVYIYSYNSNSDSFDEPADKDIFTTSNYINYASLSQDKKYLIVSTNVNILVYKNPLIEVNLIQVISFFSSFHQISTNNKFLVFIEGYEILTFLNADFTD